MRRSLLAAAALAVAFSTLALASGTTANLSWTAPTEYTDGSPLAPADIDHYTITWAPATGQAGPSGTLSVAATASSATVPFTCGASTFTITVTTAAGAKYPNATSGPSSPVPYVSGVTCGPLAPAGVTVKPGS